MFRKPRENVLPTIETPLKPSTGRPPTPPNGVQTPQTFSTMASRGSTKPLTPRPNPQSNMPSTNKQSSKKVVLAKTPAKATGKLNASILTFFKKVDSPMKDDSIFVTQGSQATAMPFPHRSPSSDLDTHDLYEQSDEGRFNEIEGPVKRRKTSTESIHSELADVSNTTFPEANAHAMSEHAYSSSPPIKLKKAKSKTKRKGPFLSDSDTDDDILSEVNEAARRATLRAQKKDLNYNIAIQTEEMIESVETKSISHMKIEENRSASPFVESFPPPDQETSKRKKRIPIGNAQAKWEALQPRSPTSLEADGSENDDLKSEELFNRSSSIKKEPETLDLPPVPSLKKEATSIDQWGNFEDVDQFPDDDDFGDGEEAVERRWMEEQARLEATETLGADLDQEFYQGFPEDSPQEITRGEMTATCPICEASLGGISSDDASRHVNGCLDGNPVPLPEKLKKEPAEVRFMPPEASNRFARKAAIPRPGQANPFDIGSNEGPSTNVFSKLMSGKAEDAAWASAAAAENASRGKPAYQRTCPFYKIMPGFFICVDAFRYGAVQGCNAYFLSHFHSDHYVGLTSTWCHGPIYCSKVTANLVKQQLRVDPKWVVALNFEERVEVPGTQGVDIIMIPANHCPGSSLFVFEKVIGKGSAPKVQRVLHCGDFRACPAHIAHPMLMPDIVNSITGKTKQQKIDVCYLDTTYLNPRYAFPCQEEVINACADMCVSLKKERAEESDAWEVVKRERAGTGMAKFLQTSVKAEDGSIAMEIGSKKTRGRLLVVCGTYSIGKERICMGIARALDCKIWAPPGKMRICAVLEDPELMARMTNDPNEAQIHMQMLMELRPETLQEYLNSYKPHFSRVVGFRPSGWNYKPPNSRFTDSPSIPTILHSSNWVSRYNMSELVPQRGSTREASCFGVPYSEHSSFRELTMFICALRIEKVVPTVNVGSAPGRAKMKAWIERWLAERRKNGCIKLGDGEGEVKW